MSHEIRYFTYKETVDKKSVQRECDHYAAMEDWHEGCTGLYRPIRWLDFSICKDYETARQVIENLDRHDYDQLAVKYYEYEQNVEDAEKANRGKKKVMWLVKIEFHT